MDFVNTELHGPQAGNCAEQFLVVGGDIWPTGFDKICGVNPDQHFYVHLDREKQAEAEQGGEAIQSPDRIPVANLATCWGLCWGGEVIIL